MGAAGESGASKTRSLPCRSCSPGRCHQPHRAARTARLERLESRQLFSAAYTVTDLGVLTGYQDLTAAGLNNSGEVVGYAGTSQSTYYDITGLQAFAYSGGQLQAIAGKDSVAAGVNDAGQVAGSYTAAAGLTGTETHAFVTNNGTLVDLHDKVLGAGHDHELSEFTLAHAISNGGQVAGEASGGNGGEPYAWVLPPSASAATAIIAGESGQGFAVNKSGAVAGSAGGVTFSQAFLFQNGQVTQLGTLNGVPFANSGARGINDAGNVVGYSDAPATPDGSVPTHAFLYTGGQLRDLGTLGGATDSDAEDINNGGVIVGNSGGKAFVYQNGAMQDLNGLIASVSGGTLNDAVAVNDKGQIAVNGTVNGHTHAFLLTPVAPAGTGSISGTFYNDANQNGRADAGEGAAGRVDGVRRLERQRPGGPRRGDRHHRRRRPVHHRQPRGRHVPGARGPYGRLDPDPARGRLPRRLLQRHPYRGPGGGGQGLRRLPGHREPVADAHPQPDPVSHPESDPVAHTHAEPDAFADSVSHPDPHARRDADAGRGTGRLPAGGGGGGAEVQGQDHREGDEPVGRAGEGAGVGEPVPVRRRRVGHGRRGRRVGRQEGEAQARPLEVDPGAAVELPEPAGQHLPTAGRGGRPRR